MLLLGLAGAGTVYWSGTHSAEPSEDELLPGDARVESRQMEILRGKMGVLTMELTGDLKQPGIRAILIAAVSILVASGYFCFGGLEDENDEVR